MTLVQVRTRPPRRVAGVDEAGRGPLAGPVVAAAVILNPQRRIHGLADSKVLTAEAIIEGDASVAAISAASILAKTCRDAMMQDLDRCYPGFHLGAHKGYSTPAHLEALRGREPSPLHRRSFSPVRVAFEAVTIALDGSVPQRLTGTSDEI